MPGTDAAFLTPGGNYRLVTMRQKAPAAKPSEILCAEPSPDWATALATAQQLSGSGGVSGGASASLNLSSSATQTISALAGRTAGVVALRDGLYSACQAYANGIIGRDAYALILSQYGNLLVALAGSNSAGGGSGGSPSSSAPSATPSGVAVAVSTGGTSAAPGSAAPKSTDTSNPASSAAGQMQLEVLQAVLVACITENDATVFPKGPTNALLNNSEVCKTLVTHVVDAAHDLLAPAQTAGGGKPGGTVAPVAKKPAPSP